MSQPKPHGSAGGQRSLLRSPIAATQSSVTSGRAPEYWNLGSYAVVACQAVTVVSSNDNKAMHSNQQMIQRASTELLETKVMGVLTQIDP